MSKEIWLGPVLGNNRERLLARCAQYLAKSEADRFLYIAASHPLLDLVTEKLLDGKQTRGVWGEFPIYLFRGFVRRVLAGATVSEARPSGRALSLEPRVAIDREDLPLRRSLISQIIKQLCIAGELKAIKPLANRDGCVNTIASLIGELQRAGKTPAEFQAVVNERVADLQAGTATETQRHREQPTLSRQTPPRTQLDFDREVALIYSTYVAALDRFKLTDEDADQLRALLILSGEVDGLTVSSPWLEEVDLLVLDGFFDFTPVQGEMLRRLLPAIPNVIVNLNYDKRNREIFAPFQTTIDQFKSFEVVAGDEVVEVNDALAPLRARLFSSKQAQAGKPAARPQDAGAPDAGAPIQFLECSDRETEIRSIAKKIKQLVLNEAYHLEEIALVVRERAAYAETILRVCANESIPCNLERRVAALDVPALRACAKLFEVLKEPSADNSHNPKCSQIAHLIKTGYFRVSRADLDALAENFADRFQNLLEVERAEFLQWHGSKTETNEAERLRARFGIGRWTPDLLENVFAYVGSDLPMNAWSDRAHRLIKELPSKDAARSFMGSEEGADDPAIVAEQELVPDDVPAPGKRKRPTPVHPLAIAWTILVMEHLQHLIADVPDEGPPEVLRVALMKLLDRLEFADQVRKPFRVTPALDVPQATLDIRGLESLRRSLAATIRSFNLAAEVVAQVKPPGKKQPLLDDTVTPIALTGFIDELERCLASQVLAVGSGNRDGLRVLEATDVRGLRFRAIFVAGMIEGGFPLRSGRDWLYPHEERERLKQYGVVLEDISTDTLLKEEHYFYQTACRAIERLCLTRPILLGDGSETVVSYYLEELGRAIAPAAIETIQVRSDMDARTFATVSTVTELATLLVRKEGTRRASLLERARSLDCLSASALRRIDIERERHGPAFGRFDGEITDSDLRAMIREYFGPGYVHSASGLNAYGNCSFRFFASRVLKLEPRNEAALDLQAIDAGKLLHDVLRRFFEQYRGQYLPDLDRQELLADMHKAANEVFRRHEETMPPLNQRIWKIDCEIRKLILEQLLIHELRLQETTNEHDVRPAYFELSFGSPYGDKDPASSPEYLKLKRPGAENEAALIQGRIDRVDVSKGNQIAIAYDYKLTKGASLDDIRTGRDVQIAIYLTALEELIFRDLELAGGGYYIIKPGTGRRNQGLYRKIHSHFTGIGTRVSANCEDRDWHSIRTQVKKLVWEFIDGMRAGNFRVDPALGRKTCKFCDFAAVCRYDQYRISRKHRN